ncbi:DNA polymerase III subunit beta [Neobittarella massiliensis]|uniref:Beta sliding clamp n=1 Tax=uncultured Anaerotruncus sp. TaxID=905011 RepID=A0A1C6J2Y2_9FIRM|nr:DNA polymerase III subunit beta [Neobittarella massiliensis]SCJ76412.1 DNA polymerase III subunit beta [uncultured Anaerotruncus sp.]
MKFVCDRQSLSEAMLNVQKAVPGKSNIPALEGVLVRTEEDCITLSGYDLELGITTRIPAEVSEHGTIVLSARLFSDIIRKLSDQQVSVEVNSQLLTTIKTQQTEFTIIGIDADEFPEMPDLDGEITLSLDQLTLKSMIDQTLYAVAQTDQKPVHTGIKFEAEDGMLTLVTVDGYRLALRREHADTHQNCQFIVPGKAASEISKLVKDSDEVAEIYLSDKHILFKVNGYHIISRLLEGNFLDYKNSIPKESETTVLCSTRDFIDSVERASIIISDRFKNPLKITFEGSTVSVLCKTPLGKVQDAFTANKQGDDVEIGFNNKYLLDALKYTHCDEVKLSFGGSLAPMTITPPEGDSFLFLVLPVRLKNEN